MAKLTATIILAACGALLVNAAAAPATVPTMQDFVPSPDVLSVELSPSGQQLMIVRKKAEDHYQVELRKTADLARGGSSFEVEPADIRGARWLTDDLILVAARERRIERGRINWYNILAVFTPDGRLKSKLPRENAEILRVDARDPAILYLAYDSTGDGSADVQRYDARTGVAERLLRGSDRRFNFKVDQTGEVRLSTTFDPTTYQLATWARSKGQGTWKRISLLSPVERDSFEPVGFLKDDPNKLLVIANAGADKAGLRVYDLEAGRIVQTLFDNPLVDVERAIVSREGQLRGVAYVTDMRHVHWFAQEDARLAARLDTLLPDRSIEIGAPSADGARIISAVGPADPGSFYLAHADGSVQPLGGARPQFRGKTLAKVELVTIAARDGRPISTYVTQQPGSSGLPLVILPHGGPWARDMGGFDDWPQLLAAQGYLVAQPQFRGSTGFGKDHWLAGDRQWGAKMQDDLDDVAQALITSKRADGDKVAMFGWSYGGYAAYVAATRGEPYKCAIVGAGVSNVDRISALLSENPFVSLVQRPTIAGPSPVKTLANARIPVFIIHGSQDSVVDVSHGRDAAKSLKTAGRAYEYQEIDGLDHTADRMSAEQRATIYKLLTGWLAGPCGFDHR